MTNQEKIVAYMKAKRQLLIWATGGAVEAVAYFNKKDANVILKWSDKQAKIIREELCEYFISPHHIIPLGHRSCPFCLIVKLDCLYCDYRKNHKYHCGHYLSTYVKLEDNINRRYSLWRDMLDRSYIRRCNAYLLKILSTEQA
jgi:hypothetical protein